MKSSKSSKIFVATLIKDDGSSPQSADVDSNFNLFLTQHEWASGGLSVNNEIVYVPCDLVGGLAMSNCGIRNVISKVLLDI